MNVLLSPQPPLFPHQHPQRLSPPRSVSPYSNMASGSRKRKADDDGDEMSVSPVNSPAVQSRQLARPAKKVRGISDVFGRSLTLPRLLETLDAAQLRQVLQAVCDQHPAIGHEIATNAPRPTASSALQVLEDYHRKFVDALPYGHSTSDYTYHRVKQQLNDLCDAITDFTPQFLPPVETQNSVSLQFLDGVTKIIHCLPDWDSANYRHHKYAAYDDTARAWALVIQEAAKRGGGFTLHTGGWEQIVLNHHQQSGGRLAAAVDALNSGVGWMGGRPPSPGGRGTGGGPSDPNSILNQIVSGNFGSAVRVGPW